MGNIILDSVGRGARTEGIGVDASCRFQMLVVVAFIGQVSTSATRLFPNAVDIFYLKNHGTTQAMSSDDVPIRKCDLPLYNAHFEIYSSIDGWPLRPELNPLGF